MESFTVENLSFKYPGRMDAALRDINFSVRQGEFVLLCGKSGCGKTTLLRLLKPTLAPHGELRGNICFGGKPLSALGTKEQASLLGFVMQNPDNQLVTDKVWHELSFGLESLGYSQAEIRTRVSEMASFFGIGPWFYKNVTELSGGQKQLLNLASVMVMQPSVLLLDEPTSQLDPIAAGEFFNTLTKINRELGVTVILTEHRLEDALSMADRVIALDAGRIIADETPREVGKILKHHDMYKALPVPVRVHQSADSALPCPLTVREGRAWLAEYAKAHALNQDGIPKDKEKELSDTVIRVRDAWFRYEKDLPDVLKGFDLSVHRGELFCLLGGNGSGKTTALSLIAGLNAPYRGAVKNDGRLGVLPQNPQSVFLEKTVYLDLMEILSDKKLTKEEKEQKVQNIAALCRIENLLENHPYDLSGGEQQRAALCKILLMEPEVLLLDEPTKGMDAAFKEEFAAILSALLARGVTILMVSHDIEFCAEYADRCALMFDGSITSVLPPRAFFKGKNFYTTSANRMARTSLPDAILAEDIIAAIGGKTEKRERPPRHEVLYTPEMKPTIEAPVADRKLPKRTMWAAFLILLLIPLTLYGGSFLLVDRKYYFISLAVLLETMIPFGMAFEGRKPKARELIVISVLCAITVISRAAFFMLPHFKPVVALVILAGVSFGGETGFLVGAVSAFISNFFFGQGPWTPWQMFALGIIGFMAGVCFKKGCPTKITLSLFGFFMALFVYGGIMNPASIIMWQNKITWEMIATALVAGAPFDFVHALSTAFFLWVISRPMLDKLARIKMKYGLMERR